MGFHSTPRRDVAWVPLLALLKASTAMEIIRTVGRVALTFIPFILFKNHASRRFLRHVEKHKADHPGVELPGHSEKMLAKKSKMLRGIRQRTLLFHALMFTPIILFWVTVIACMERTPLTGRWRLILLSPEEEDEIANQLAGPGWYQAVGEIIAKDGPPTIIPPSDWRYAWVRDTLRSLETAIPHLGDEHALEPVWLDRGPDDIPLPPPADYPLRPRPRGTEYIRQIMSQMPWACSVVSPPSIPHIIPGPPYSLILIDDPNSCNAFSYGFGPDGAGGIVVFSGFLDKIVERHPAPNMKTMVNVPLSEETSWWASLFGSVMSVTPPVQHLQPTPAQTSDLAILLAHELSHLILSHHLETLSSFTIFVPGMLSIVSDVLRTLLFPVTMFFGPFVNDAVANLGKAGSTELSKLGELCSTVKQEIEADVVSARLLAYAGFDPRLAMAFWEHRAMVPSTAECTPGSAIKQEKDKSTVAMKIMGSGHPINEVRIEKLRDELARWRRERDRVVDELQALSARRPEHS
ncbi:hypothetical protein FA95DRAFT_1677283 [Auriscalpium vulgare]|uniref:Uncharacterized protein n=1 Tax=Auriscalpium vulgare TaxID=40419 RepID=A0ACB8S0D4_9AGAM|nr:hypothetical protein FA95DRAFT_1677283 [Auriscalpium vulgare]